MCVCCIYGLARHFSRTLQELETILYLYYLNWRDISTRMNKFDTITVRGAQAIEATANGIDRTQLARLTFLTDNTVRKNVMVLVNSLGVSGCYSRITRVMSVAIANKALLPKDLKAPGEIFSFTMDGDRKSWGASQAIGHYVMPKGEDQPIGTQTVSPLLRTYLSYLSFGMSMQEILDDPLLPQPEGLSVEKIKLDIRRGREHLGFISTQQMVAHAALSGVIDIPPDIWFKPDIFQSDVRPLIYHEPIDWHIDRPSYRPEITIP